MNWDLLLEWMTHHGSGAWSTFCVAVAELTGRDEEFDGRGLNRTLRVAFSDLGHADFFVGGSRRWRVLHPAVVGLAGNRNHLLVGGRTRTVVDRLSAAAIQEGATVNISEFIPGLSRVQVVGERDAVRAASMKVGLEYLSDAAAVLAGRLPSIRSTMQGSAPAVEPINWSVKSWSFQTEAWVVGKLDRTVREYKNRYEVRRYLVHLGRLGLREIEKRAAVYCAASVRSTRLVRYSCEDRSLRVPLWAPLPEGYARAACLAGGQLGIVQDDDIIFHHVDPRVASILLIGLGQGFPTAGQLR
jgi:hypothetical protein